MAKKPKGLPLTITRWLDNGIRLSALTSDAERFVEEHAPEFGMLTDEKEHLGHGQYILTVYINYDLTEVLNYLTDLFEE